MECFRPSRSESPIPLRMARLAMVRTGPEWLVIRSIMSFTVAKRAILSGMGLSLRDGLKHSMDIFLNELYGLEDSQEGLRALVEKRKPNWKNR